MHRLRFSIRLTVGFCFFLLAEKSLSAFSSTASSISNSGTNSIPGDEIRVKLNRQSFDAKEPAIGDFMDCALPKGPCQAVLIPRIMSDEKVVLPRNKGADDFRFLMVKGLRAMGGDPLVTVALFSKSGGDSVFADLNNDEDLGNDGAPTFWAKGDSCISLKRMGGGAAPLMLCHAGPKAKVWKSKCNGLKTELPWAICDEAPIRLAIEDMSFGTLSSHGKERFIGVCDLDGDGKFRLGAGDRFLFDWNGDNLLEKSMDGDGFAMPVGDHAFRFSTDLVTYELVSVDENGSWIDLKRLHLYDPSAVAFKAIEGSKAPDIRFVNLDGDTMSLSDFKGKKIMIQFWSTLCKLCLDDIADVREFQKSFGAKNWQIISLTTDNDLAQVQQASLKYHMDWMVGMAGPEARGYYATRPLPMNVKIDADGVLEKKGVSLGRRTF
jgi:thiol-disulfide isomerase/thioredoxin